MEMDNGHELSNMKTFDQGSESNLQARWQRLLQLLGLLLVRDLQGVEEARASDLEFKSGVWSPLIVAVSLMIYLELDIVSILLDLDALSILPPGLQKEILDLLDFTWHCETSARVNFHITILSTVFRYC